MFNVAESRTGPVQGLQACSLLAEKQILLSVAAVETQDE